MENRLVLNEEISTFLDVDNNPLWSFIVNNEIENLLALSDEQDTIKVAKELFTSGESSFLGKYDFVTPRELNGVFIRDMVRLMFALDINGKHDELLSIVNSKLMDALPEVVDRIQKDTFGYPARLVDNHILSEAATIRAAIVNMIYYYKHKGDLDALHFVTVLRTTLTLAIMGNYKNVIGHDLVETAKIKEQIGETDAALTFYNGARDNLKNELHWFVESPEMGPSEEDAVMLQSLKEAFLSIDRINKTSLYSKECGIIEEVLTREYVEFEFDEEDDDED